MIAFYVQGGGLGHLSRTTKLVKILKLNTTNVVIITASGFTNYFNEFAFIKLNWKDEPASWSKIILKTFLKLEITQCYVDAFPLGIKGELVSVYKNSPQISFYYVSRILKWKKYLGAMPWQFEPKFEATLLLETLYPEHLQWIKQHSNSTQNLQLGTETPSTGFKLYEFPYVLVIHSGGAEDVKKILAAALSDYSEEKNTKFIVYTQVDIEVDQTKIEIRKDIFPVTPYFKHAEKIYTAGGFNLMQELKPFRNKHIAIPLERLYDDQKFRIANQ